MPFKLPSFNLVCNIWSVGALPPLPARLSPACNLAWGRRVNPLPSGGSEVVMTLLLPAGTDIRSSLTFSGADVVEVPAGSGRFYSVFGVDDIAKGFANEHRGAILLGVRLGGAFWPTPIP
jgi:hypothetical protein